MLGRDDDLWELFGDSLSPKEERLSVRWLRFAGQNPGGDVHQLMRESRTELLHRIEHLDREVDRDEIRFMSAI